MATAKRPVKPQLTKTAVDWNQDTGYHLMKELLRLRQPPDGVFCASDDLAAGAVLAAQEAGYTVPVDLAVVGFDDRRFAAHLPTPLTTVALPLEEMGRVAATALLERLHGVPGSNVGIERVACRLMVRRSSVEG